MMKKRLSPKDFKVLSAYLDGQLTPRESDRLEARLAEEKGLKETLIELRRTRQLLRAVPRLRAPRNFTLTPEMVGKRQPSGARLYPAFRLASAVATLLFVAVVVGDLFGGSFQYMSGRDQAASQVAVHQEMEAPAGEEMGAAESEEVPEAMVLEMPSPESTELAESQTDAFRADRTAPQEPGIEGLAEEAFPTFTPEMEDALAESMPFEEQVEAEAEAPMMMQAPPEEENVKVGSEPYPMEPPLGDAQEGDIGEEPEQYPVPEFYEESREIEKPAAKEQVSARQESGGISGSGVLILRVVEISLAVIALVSGGLAIYLYRRA
jgi:hypothetical protein